MWAFAFSGRFLQEQWGRRRTLGLAGTPDLVPSGYFQAAWPWLRDFVSEFWCPHMHVKGGGASLAVNEEE